MGIAAGAAAAALGRPAPAPSDGEPEIGLLAARIGDGDVAGVGGSGAVSGVVPVLANAPPRRDDAAQLAGAEKIRADRAEQRQREHEATHNRMYAPVQGRITSNYGPRWGTTHYGLDIANAIGTPIVAPAPGVVVDAGPASGFGLWVRIRHDDGTVTVYGHIDSYAVREGQRVEAGQVIAAVGNRGQSTGPHLHFEVWDPSGRKVDPLAWLQERGVRIG